MQTTNTRMEQPFTINTEAFLRNPETVPVFDFVKVQKDSLIDLSKPVDKPPVALQIDGTDVLSFGNIGTIIGKAKSKKTFFISQIIASCIAGKWDGKISANITSEKKKVVFMDTEQGHWHVQNVHRRINRLLDKDTSKNLPTFEAYKLREYSTLERLQFIEQYVYKTDDLAVLIIDGVRDLVTSINDEDQATEIVGKLMKWSEQRKIAIIVVLHMNKGDNNARGHIGTELMNKSEAVISIEKDNNQPDRSIVSSLFQRGKEFNDFAFKISDTGLPTIDSVWKPSQKDSRPTKKPIDCPIEKHIEILSELKRILKVDGTKLAYGKMSEQLKYCINKKWKKVGVNMAKDYFTYYQNEGHILAENEGKTTLYSVV